MNILFAASEVAPFIKTGGLADVAGSLPQALAEQGHDVKVVLPLYQGIGENWRSQMKFLSHFHINLAWRTPYCGLFELQHDNITYIFVDNEHYYRRADLYGHFDDGERFAYFCRAILAVPEALNWHPDILHCNDWQTALVPIYMLEEREKNPFLRGTKSVFTIHNIEYQGRYADNMLEDVIGLPRSYFHEEMLSFYNDINLVKGAVYASDYITTVSNTYAHELQHAFFAHGLEGVIAHNSYKMKGIVNGLDVELYNPASGKDLATPFSIEDLSGKAVNKAELQKQLGLEVRADVPLIACISRLVSHKGFELVVNGIHEIMGMDVQMVVLGTGAWQYEEAFRNAAAKYPGRFSAQIRYSGPLSTAIYAGADLFLMPSISEPCGLSQIIAMRYGTVPIVRETGGLKDTVPPYHWGEEGGRGFVFHDIKTADMIWSIGEAVGLYRQNPHDFYLLQKDGMTADFSWKLPAQEYLGIYKGLVGEGTVAVPFEEAPQESVSKVTIPDETTSVEAAVADPEAPYELLSPLFLARRGRPTRLAAYQSAFYKKSACLKPAQWQAFPRTMAIPHIKTFD